MGNAETVPAICEAFGRSDVPTILDRLDEAVERQTAATVPEEPRLQARRGKAGVEGFFEPRAIFDGSDKVFLLVGVEAASHGKCYAFPDHGHAWRFNAAGEVVAYGRAADAAPVIRLARGERRLPGPGHAACRLADDSVQQTALRAAGGAEVRA